MKIKTIVPLFFLIVIVVFSSCSKDNDAQLRGKWQVQYEIRSGVMKSVDTVFYNFDSNVLCIQAVLSNDNCNNVFGRFFLQKDSLKMEFIDEEQINNLHGSRSFGWNSTDHVRVFLIKKISSDQLILQDDQSELYMRKF